MDDSRTDSHSVADFEMLVADHQKLKIENERLRALLHSHGIDAGSEAHLIHNYQDNPIQQLEMQTQNQVGKDVVSK